ncbi:MAG: hypothetical protein GEU28_01545, partial [Dehalococcoidia bacterium]|nr:hypothetical protein [Dehalococcoidia bacterium]
GEPISAQDALRVGLVNAVVPAAAVMDEARRWADLICKRGPLAVRASKKAMTDGIEMALDDGLKLEQRLFFSLANTEDFKEGLDAFSRRAEPNFKGR